jgi:hypothetical protein
MLADMQAALVPPELESHQQVEPIAAEAQQGPELRRVLQRVTSTKNPSAPTRDSLTIQQDRVRSLSLIHSEMAHRKPLWQTCKMHRTHVTQDLNCKRMVSPSVSMLAVCKW